MKQGGARRIFNSQEPIFNRKEHSKNAEFKNTRRYQTPFDNAKASKLSLAGYPVTKVDL